MSLSKAPRRLAAQSPALTEVAFAPSVVTNLSVLTHSVCSNLSFPGKSSVCVLSPLSQGVQVGGFAHLQLQGSEAQGLTCPTPALLPPKGLFILTSPVPSPASQLQLPLRSGIGPQLVQAVERTSSHSTSPGGHKQDRQFRRGSGWGQAATGHACTPACSFARCGCEAQQIRNTSHSVLVQGTGYPGATAPLFLSGTCQMLTLIKPYQKHNLFLLTKCSCPCRYTDHKEGRLPMASTPLTLDSKRRQSPHVWLAFSTLMSFLSRGCAQQGKKRPRGLSSTKIAPPCLPVEDGPTTQEGNYPTYLLKTMHT